MATPIQMPSLSPTMTEGKILKWLKKEGDKVSSGDAIAEVETDKSNLEIEAYDDGTLLKILTPEGEMAKVGAPIAFIGARGEKLDESALKGGASAAEAPKQEAPPAPAPPPPQQKAAPRAAPEAPRAPEPKQTPREEAPSGGRLRASPLAKKMARDQGLNLADIEGSGPQGRIVKRDIEAALESGGATPAAAAPAAKAKIAPFVPPVFGRQEPTSSPVSQMRKVIGQRMGEVKPGVPHFYLTVEVEMDAAMKIREEAKALESKVSVNDIIVKAAGVALRRYPKINVSYQGDKVVQFKNADVGVAVAMEEGLITPIVKDADQKGLAVISAEVRDLADRAKRRALKPEEYTGGSITVSNLGMYGIDEFIAVINPPQAAILAVGAVQEKAVVRAGQIVARKMMSITLSGDHRVIDGAVGAEYLRELKALLEHPMRLLF